MAKKAPKSTSVAEHKAAETNHEALGLERLVFFSDAVIAIAITLLALEIRLPAGEGALTDQQLLHSLLAIWPSYLGYAISFWVIGGFWIAHHRRFRLIVRYDRTLLWINLFFLMTIAFIPFPTTVLSEYGNRTATIFYALTMTVAGLLSLAMWAYAAHNNRLIDAHFGRQQRRHEWFRTLIQPGVFLLSIGLALIDDDLAKYSWLLIALLARFV